MTEGNGDGGDSLLTVWGVTDDGAVAEIRVPADFEQRLDEFWPPLGLARASEPSGPVLKRLSVVRAIAGTILVEVDDEVVPGGWERVESDLALFASERLAGRVAVHAAVIDVDGLALVVPGPSYTGKSRLCLAAAAAGLGVLSDEYALVDPATGLITGWRRPVRMRVNGKIDRRDVLAPSETEIAPGLIALLRYEPGTPPYQESISPAEAVMGLLANTVCARLRPNEAMDAVVAVARSCPAVQGTRGDAAIAIRELAERITK